MPHLYVHYDDGAVAHLFHVAAGLDSMVVGEGQILGQAREALRLGQECGTLGARLNALFQQALRVGKRVHAETDIDRAAPSLVSVALDRATAHVGDVRAKRVLVVGAGAMAGLAVATVAREGAAEIVVANRTYARAERLAAQYGGRAIRLERRRARAGRGRHPGLLHRVCGRGAAARDRCRRPHLAARPAGRHRPRSAARRRARRQLDCPASS